MSQISIRNAIRCKNIVSGYIMWFNICPCHKWLFMMCLLLINSADEPHWLAKAGSGIFLSIAQQYSRVYVRRLFIPWTFISSICSTKCILLHLTMIGEGWEAMHAQFMASKRYREEVGEWMTKARRLQSAHTLWLCVSVLSAYLWDKVGLGNASVFSESGMWSRTFQAGMQAV